MPLERRTLAIFLSAELGFLGELKSYDPKATADDELFDPGTGTVVEGIDYLSIMESLSELQTANECKMQRD